MSINGLIESSRRSFRALDGAMNTAGQNVANADTEGYARRRVALRADSTVGTGIHTRSPQGTFTGAGVSIDTFERLRDGLLQRAGWTGRAGLGAADEEHRVLATLEGLFPAGEGGLGALLNRFWSGWSDVADAPASTGARLALRADTEALTSTVRRLDADLRTLEAETATALNDRVDEANRLMGSIADLNTTIRAARQAGTPNFDAEDRRDLKVADLARLLPVRVEPGDDYLVSVGGVSVVDANGADRLVFDGTDEPPTLTFEDARLAFRAPADADGAVGALFRTLTGALPNTRAGLDALAAGLVTAVNALHTDRYDDAGMAVAPAAPPFFDPAGTTAATFRLSDAVAADASLIGTPGFFTAAGDEIAVAVAALREASLPGLGTTSEGAATDLMADVGARVSRAAGRSASQGAVVDHLDAMERAVSGVSVDDELAGLIRYQQAFGAAARVLSTAQQMMDTLLTI